MALLRTFRGTHQLDAYNGAPGVTEVATFGNANCNVSVRFYDNHDSNSCYNMGMSNANLCVVSPAYPTVFSVGSYAPQANLHVQGTAFITSNTSVFGTLGIGTTLPASNAAMQVIGTFRSDYITAPLINTSNGYVISGWVNAGIVLASSVRCCNITTLYDGPVNAGKGTVSCGMLSNTTIQTGAITALTVHVQQDAIIDNAVIANTFKTNNGTMTIRADGSMSNTLISSASITANQITTNNNGPINAGNGSVTCGDITATGIVKAVGYIEAAGLRTSNNGNLNLQNGTVICGRMQCGGEIATNLLSMTNLACTSLAVSSINLQSPNLTGFPYNLIMTCTSETQALTTSASAPVCTFYTTGVWSFSKIRASLSSPGTSSTTTIDVRIAGSTVISSATSMTFLPGALNSTEITIFNGNAQLIPDNTQVQVFCTAADTAGSAQGLKVAFFYVGDATTTTNTSAYAPSAVTNVTVTSITASSVVINFTPALNATSYTIVSIPPSLQTSQSASGSGYMFTGLSPNTSYTFAIISVNSFGNSVSANSIPVTTSPANSGNVRIGTGQITQTSIPLSFAAVSGALSYSIVSSPGNLSYTVSTSNVLFSNLAPGTAYTFTVTASNVTGLGQPTSNLIPFTTLSAAVSNIGVLSSDIITPSSIPITFDTVIGVTTYNITAAPDNITQTTTAVPYTFSNLQPGIGHTFTIVSTNASGFGGSASNAVPYVTAPPAVTNLSLVPTTSNILINFTPAISAANYIITSSPSPDNIQFTSAAPYTYSNLQQGTSYTLTITSVNATGIVGGSVSSNISTGLPVVSDVRAVGVTPTSIILNFVPALSATSYNITATSVTTGQSILPARIATSSGYAYTGLNPNTSYTFTIQTVYGTTSGASIVTSPFTTTPGTVTNILATAGHVTPTSIPISFSPVSGATSYIITTVSGSYTQAVTLSGLDQLYQVYRGGAIAITTTASNLLPGTTYTFNIQSSNAYGLGGIASTTLSTTPAATSNIIPISGMTTASSILLSFSPVTGATIYSFATTPPTSIQQTDGTNSSYTFSNLSAGSNYVFAITSSNISGNGGVGRAGPFMTLTM